MVARTPFLQGRMDCLEQGFSREGLHQKMSDAGAQESVRGAICGQTARRNDFYRRIEPGEDSNDI